ncbi:MAG TPA: leucine--tRNA ligase, partial [Planctomycetota bacterium]|nr:leucine--tRNA ligase [Planctomycetota bacterium]
MTTARQTRGVYDHRAIEARWQERWLSERTFAAKDDRALPKAYILDFFPYPSGTGLHVGHPLGYIATDIVARYKRHRGFNVLHPMGWDAFGLPAEQHALKTGVHPALTTRSNIETFRRQLRAFGFSYDWAREVDTTDPSYYRWTQWIFLKLHERGLAYQAEVPVNWCPALGTVLANEEVIDGKSEVGGHPVVKRPMKQWLLRITAYAERLEQDLDLVDWPEHIKLLQRNWIGRSTGAEVDFRVESPACSGELPPGTEAINGVGSYDTGQGPVLRIFTTRPDTLFGATYMVLAPEHPLLDALIVPERRAECDAYRQAAAGKTDIERSALGREKTGVFTGRYAINPVNSERLPVWIADYVMLGYGTGAIMAVPGHDERDHEFARAHELPIVEVVRAPGAPATADPRANVAQAAYTGDGLLVNSGLLDGLDVPAAKARITAWLAQHGHGAPAVHTRLRDWLFSRQRYWGEPFPILYRDDGSVATVREADLPVRLPEVERYQPSGTGESPLATVSEWVATTDPATGRPARRETHTMPQWAGSCWYYLRFIDPKNEQALVDPALEKYWMPVDLYVGGAEHATLHLLYARFWHKVLFDCGVVSTPEPFAKLYCQGMILGEDHEKMSKSRGNTVSPDDVLPEYGADAFRLYEMFMGPLTATKPWQTSGLAGTHRFLKRVWRLYVAGAPEGGADGGRAAAGPGPELALSEAPPDEDAARAFHLTLAKVTADVESLEFNTAVSTMMEFVNLLTRKGTGMPRAFAQPFLIMLCPFAPHLCEELNALVSGPGAPMLAWARWPEADASRLVVDEVEIPVQVNGKTRATIKVAAGLDAGGLEAAARGEAAVARHLSGASVRKVIAVPGRVINF